MRGRRARNAHLRTVAAAVVETVQAPPAVVFLHALQCQIPTAVRLTESLPQKVHLEHTRSGGAAVVGQPATSCVDGRDASSACVWCERETHV